MNETTTGHSFGEFPLGVVAPAQTEPVESPPSIDQEPPQPTVPCHAAASDERPGARSGLSRRLSLWYNRWLRLPAIRFFEGVILRRHAERLYLVFGGHIFFQTLRTAVKLDLFSLLARHRRLTRAEIARHLGIDEQPARIILLGLTSVGLLRKRGKYYSNTYVANRLLAGDSPRKITAYVELEHQGMYAAMPWLYESVLENRNVGLREFHGDEPTFYQRLAHHPELEQIFQDAMQELSVQTNADLARFVDFSGVRHVVDVGGGDGTNLMQLVRQWPHLTGTVFDSPTVCEIARANIAASGMADRVRAVPGDCFADAFPADADCLLFAHFFTIWSPERDRALLKKCYESLRPGGKVIVFNMMQRDDERGPLSAAVGSPYFLTLATGEGMLYTWSEYRQWMQRAGFADVKNLRLPRDHGAIVGTKP